MAITLKYALLATMLLPCASAAWADDTQPTEQSTQVAPTTAPEKKWKFATVGYLWFASAKGETDVIGPLPPVGLDIKFGTILKHLKFGFMGAAEARRDRLVFLGDVMWVHMAVSKGIDIRDKDFVDARLDSNSGVLTALGGYRVADQAPITVDLLAGGRINHSKTSLKLSGPQQTASGSVAETWIDPLVAVRANAALSDRASLTLYGDVGGGGSDIDWQGLATVNYQISRKMRLGAGWRYFKVKYDKGGFLYDVAQSGPIIVFRTDF